MHNWTNNFPLSSFHSLTTLMRISSLSFFINCCTFSWLKKFANCKKKFLKFLSGKSCPPRKGLHSRRTIGFQKMSSEEISCHLLQTLPALARSSDSKWRKMRRSKSTGKFWRLVSEICDFGSKTSLSTTGLRSWFIYLEIKVRSEYFHIESTNSIRLPVDCR